MREKDEVISEFYKNYEENDLKKVKSVDPSELWIKILMILVNLDWYIVSV